VGLPSGNRVNGEVGRAGEVLRDQFLTLLTTSQGKWIKNPASLYQKQNSLRVLFFTMTTTFFAHHRDPLKREIAQTRPFLRSCSVMKGDLEHLRAEKVLTLAKNKFNFLGFQNAHRKKGNCIQYANASV